MRGAEAWVCGAVQTRGFLGESKTSERFEACCIRLAGGRKGGKQLAAGQSLVGIHQPRKETPASRRTAGEVMMWDVVCVDDIPMLLRDGE